MSKPTVIIDILQTLGAVVVLSSALIVAIYVTCWAADVLNALRRIADALEALRYDKEEADELQADNKV